LEKRPRGKKTHSSKKEKGRTLPENETPQEKAKFYREKSFVLSLVGRGAKGSPVGRGRRTNSRKTANGPDKDVREEA